MNSLEPLFNPRGIAIAGASGELTRTGGQVLCALNHYGFRGGVFPVNPKYAELAGRRCYATLQDIDQDCDLAVIALPASHVPGMIAQCGARGIRYAVVLSSGFRESGEQGAALEAQMLAAARKAGIRIIGPNCLGLVNVQARVFAAFGSLTRPPELKPGPVSVAVQSGGFGISIVIRCAMAGIGFRYLVASGNESDITMPELINAYVDDEHTRVIPTYLEGVADGRALMAAPRRALAVGKPVIVFKAGNTRRGKLAAASHTANLTGSYEVYRAAFRQCGIIEVYDIDHAVDVVTAFSAGRLPRGNNVCVMGGSGGSAAVFSDVAEQLGLGLPSPAGATLETLTASLPPLSSLTNPIDYSAGNPRPNNARDFLQAFDALLADQDIHQLGAMFAPVMGEQLRLAADLLASAATRSDKPIFVFSAMSPDLAPEGLDILRQAGIPVFPSPRRMAQAMRALADYGNAVRRRDKAETSPVPAKSALPVPPARPMKLNEQEAKALLAAAGIRITRDICLPCQPLAPLPEHIVFPVAVKIVSRDIGHKTDIGGVRLDVRDAEQLEVAIVDILANARAAAPRAKLDGILVSEMIKDGVETIVGIVGDPGFGPVVAFGLGGVLAETLNDVTFRIAPFGLTEAREMIGELRGSALFHGLRGKPPADVEALAQTLVSVSELAWRLRAELSELDINPLIVRPCGFGVAAADALAVFR